MVSSLGVGLAVIAACCLAGQALTIRLASRDGQTKDILLVVMLFNTIVFVPLAFLVDPTPHVTMRGVLAFVGAGIVGTLVGRAFFYTGIKRVGASRAETIKASMPLHATVLAEAMTLGQFSGVVLIVLGIGLVSLEAASSSDHPGDPDSVIGFLFPLVGAFFLWAGTDFCECRFCGGNVCACWVTD